METLLFLFPHFNFSAPEKEAYFNMFDPGDDNALTRDGNSRFRDKDRKSRLSLLLSKSGSHENVSPEKKATTTVNSTSPATALRWSDSFEELLNDSDGVKTFTQFLRTEFSEENIEFWLACEDYKTTESNTKLPSKAKQIYAVYIENDSPKEINIDHSTRVAIQKIIAQPTTTCFDVAQGTIYALMKKDCYPRFLKSDIYLSLTRRKAPGAMTRRRSRSFVFNERGEPAFGSDSRL
ncbi:regulator of G-protein signaling 18 [Clupea harengus]|uniref:Regulator of G-protein signaling 18 n=1 Tax=Clupea harengus TaxID=7950 RepID=A0A8M1KIZ2_CLUHA|nr:regulator of G-protein signaling 18 [Clupea harengus]